MPEVIGDDEYRHQRLNALRAEVNELIELFRTGVLKQYVYLDLLAEMQRKQDHIITEHRLKENIRSPRRANVFLRIEDALVKWLREKDWAADLMANYQNKRLSSHLMRDIAGILMSEAALKHIKNDKTINEAHRSKLEYLYNEQVNYFRNQLNNTRNSFPEFFGRFETNLCSHAALVAARQSVVSAYHQGSLAPKVYAWLEHRLHTAISELPPINAKVSNLQAQDLIRLVPLFNGLPDKALEQIASVASPVNYLENDTIIGTSEHGDASVRVDSLCHRINWIVSNRLQPPQSLLLYRTERCRGYLRCDSARSDANRVQAHAWRQTASGYCATVDGLWDDRDCHLRL